MIDVDDVDCFHRLAQVYSVYGNLFKCMRCNDLRLGWLLPSDGVPVTEAPNKERKGYFESEGPRPKKVTVAPDGCIMAVI